MSALRSFAARAFALALLFGVLPAVFVPDAGTADLVLYAGAAVGILLAYVKVYGRPSRR